ncbi:hypothetical protein A2696_00340 [Candidatus Curtissbacteria bacterium RIFCSPHIGHO2_01_FULL_41_13]|uniref:Helix-turn-helix type 11 domain-containing protein n=1 Tax=Candidatus Curtissbacteria bacterium RIFCSPHIGHO2_01_FULL_41_13 TaxID=1797745 RepID=A0A1F5G2A8_9BACT|nr:MAG: hypothetical protein A2696_00340 [Candidatus Curtissbacteria bacterium RIFCSPHIGHO2_01_FULL_41_13]
MKKIEIVWRELLFWSIEKKNRQFTQKELAAKFGFSTSTIFQALKIPRKAGAVRVTGRYFTLEDAEKLLYYWASVRNFEREIILAAHTDLSPFEIEAQMPANVVFGSFTAAYKILGGKVPADYDTVYVYCANLAEIKRRFEIQKGKPNLIVLTPDRFLAPYGQTTTISQTFVDLWNIPVWYAKEYVNSLKEKIDELLS